MATPLARDPRRCRGPVRRLQPRGPLHVVRGLRGQGRAPPAHGRVPGSHRRAHRVRLRADRALLPRARDLPDRGLRPRARRDLERAQAGHLRGRRRLLAVRDQDDLDRRGRRPRLHAPRGGRARARVSQLRQADLRGLRAQLPDERVHRRARAGPDRADAGDRRLEERGRARRARPGVSEPARAARRDDLGSLQVHRVRLARALDRPRLRRAVPPDPRPRRRAAATPTGSRATIPAFRSTTDRISTAAHESPRHRRIGLHRLARGRQAPRLAATSR